MTTINATADARPEKTVKIVRIFDAPRALVWKAWTDPKQLAQWWGPKSFTNPVCELDLRIGGAIRIDMRGPNGTVYPMAGTFREIIPPERLVFMAEARDHDGNVLLESLTTVSFEEQAGKTKLTVHAHAVGLAPIAPQMLAGMDAGWTQSIERLQALVSGAS
jgi:uncharacterized protein YndB with AHSA1/START domain